jgi:hypothetical protein
MDEKNENIEFTTQKKLNARRKLLELKEKALDMAEGVVDFCIEHKEQLALVATPLVIGGVKELIKNAKHNQRVNETRELKNKYIYDRSTGHYWHLRRELSEREWMEFESRKAAGERVSEILSSMRVLK